MTKVFLYLYPIEEFTKMFMLSDDSLYDEWNIERPLPILNETIDKRYREKGYQVVYALYPDKELYGLKKYPNDRIIYTDIRFSEASAIDEHGNVKKDFIPKYPSEEYLLNELGHVDELVVGGYHAMDCVKKLAEVAKQNNINVLVDLDLTDLFFNLYKQKEYFQKDNYDLERFKHNAVYRLGDNYSEFQEKMFEKNYASPVYGFYTDDLEKHNKR